jgi:hypothetical protein
VTAASGDGLLLAASRSHPQDKQHEQLMHSMEPLRNCAKGTYQLELPQNRVGWQTREWHKRWAVQVMVGQSAAEVRRLCKREERGR